MVVVGRYGLLNHIKRRISLASGLGTVYSIVVVGNVRGVRGSGPVCTQGQVRSEFVPYPPGKPCLASIYCLYIGSGVHSMSCRCLISQWVE